MALDTFYIYTLCPSPDVSVSGSPAHKVSRCNVRVVIVNDDPYFSGVMSPGHTCAPWEYRPGVSQVCAGWCGQPGLSKHPLWPLSGRGAWPRPQKLPPPTCHFDIWLWLTSAEKCAKPWCLRFSFMDIRFKNGKQPRKIWQKKCK